MIEHLSIETTVCSEYQRLLEESQRALEIWNKYRAEICQSRLIGQKAANELLRLQAKLSRAYTMLQNHAHNCLRCQLVQKIEGCDSEGSSDSSLTAHYTIAWRSLRGASS
jgi:hypothetical protein